MKTYVLTDLHYYSKAMADKRIKKGSERYNDLLFKYNDCVHYLNSIYGAEAIAMYLLAIDNERAM